jgi:hypothetical protein
LAITPAENFLYLDSSGMRRVTICKEDVKKGGELLTFAGRRSCGPWADAIDKGRNMRSMLSPVRVHRLTMSC